LIAAEYNFARSPSYKPLHLSESTGEGTPFQGARGMEAWHPEVKSSHRIDQASEHQLIATRLEWCSLSDG
jgi:hypothetical protein